MKSPRLWPLLVFVSTGVAAAGPLHDHEVIVGPRLDLPAPAFLAARAGATLGPPSALPPGDAARAFLRAGVPGAMAPIRVELALAGARTYPDGGTMVRFQQRLEGVSVLGAEITVRLGADGAPLWLMSALESPARVLGARKLTPMQAVDRAFLYYAPMRAGETSDPGLARAVIAVLPDGTLRRAYHVNLPTRVELLSAMRCVIDAETGAPLMGWNRVRTANQARVWPVNPVVSTGTMLVNLPGVTANQPYPQDELVVGQNCVNNHQTTSLMTPFGNFTIHICSEVQTAGKDGTSLDWDYAQVVGAGSSKSGEGDGTTPNEVNNFDKFAEVSMYYHVRRSYDSFRELLGPQFRVRQAPLPAIANYRLPFDSTNPDFQSQFANAMNPNGTLYPVVNAAYVPRGNNGIQDRAFDSLLFGQGTIADFAYDGLTATHEFTHAVIDTTTQLGSHRVNRWGLDNAPGALNEGYADYFAGAFLGTPMLDSYLGPQLDAFMGEHRRLDQDLACPSNLEGEVHHDSMPWSGALWAARGLLATTPERGKAFDTAVMRALDGLTQTPSFEQAAMATLAELTSMTATFNAADVMMARTALTMRGQIACERVVAYDGPRRLLTIEGTRSAGVQVSPFMPGYLQWRYLVSSPARALTVNIAQSDGGAGGAGGNSAMPRVIVRRGADPIQFTYQGANVTGNQETELTTTMTKTTSGWSAEVVSDFSPGPVHVMIVNHGTSATVGRMISISATPGSNFMDAGPEPDATVAEPDAGTPPGGGGGGCGCRTGGARVGGAWWITLVTIFGLLGARRRRWGR